MIRLRHQQKVSSLNDSQLKIILSAGTYSIEQFNQKMKDAIKGEKWVAAQIKDYKLIIPEHHTFIASALLFRGYGSKHQLPDKYEVIADYWEVSNKLKTTTHKDRSALWRA